MPAARADHQHALPAPAAPVSVTRAPASAGGTSTSLARADHLHRTEVGAQLGGVAVGSRPALNFAGAVTVVDNGGQDRVDVTITAAGLTNDPPTQIDVGDGAQVGASTEAARADHQHALPAPAAPVSVTRAPASAGAATTVARADHKHDVATAAPVTAAGPTSAEGTSTSLARADHLHRTEVGAQLGGVAVGSRPALNFAGAVTVVDNGGQDRVDVTITAAGLTNATPTQIDVGDAATCGATSSSTHARAAAGGGKSPAGFERPNSGGGEAVEHVLVPRGGGGQVREARALARAAVPAAAFVARAEKERGRRKPGAAARRAVAGAPHAPFIRDEGEQIQDGSAARRRAGNVERPSGFVRRGVAAAFAVGADVASVHASSGVLFLRL